MLLWPPVNGLMTFDTPDRGSLTVLLEKRPTICFFMASANGRRFGDSCAINLKREFPKHFRFIWGRKTLWRQVNLEKNSRRFRSADRFVLF